MFGEINLLFFIKVPILVLIFLYALFSLVLFNKIRSLSEMVFISNLNISAVLTFLTLAHLVAAISLFVLSLVIL